MTTRLAWDHYDYKISEYVLPALINGDTSGIDDAEAVQLKEWEQEACKNATDSGFTIGHWSHVDDSGEDWGRCAVSGLFSMRCSVQLMVYKILESSHGT